MPSLCRVMSSVLLPEINKGWGEQNVTAKKGLRTGSGAGDRLEVAQNIGIT